MDNITHIGLDVHKDTIAVATLQTGEQYLRRAGDREHA